MHNSHADSNTRLGHRIEAGDLIPRHLMTTIRSEQIQVPASTGLTHLQFRRYAGCPICNLHLRTFELRYEDVLAAGVKEVVVFHSSVEDMLPHQGHLPFAVVADPGKNLYAEFGVESSLRAVLHPSAWSTPLKPRVWGVVLRGIRAGGSPSPAKGESPLGMPADVLIAPDGRVIAAKYGRHANDQWSVDELIQLASAAESRREEIQPAA